jgi:hypothetical protein
MTNCINEDYSFYIPHVFANITKERIIEVFRKQDIGIVGSIDFVSKKDKNNISYNAAYIHFKEGLGCNENSIVYNIKMCIQNGKEARIMYDDPWYWIVLKNNTKKYIVPLLETQDTMNMECLNLVDEGYAYMLENIIQDLRNQIEELNNKIIPIDIDSNEYEFINNSSNLLTSQKG